MWRLLRIFFILAMAVAGLIMNHFDVVRNHVSRDHDIAYFAKRCSAEIKPEEAENLVDHVYYDRGTDHKYLYQGTGRTFFIGSRSLTSEFFTCFRYAGCVLPPRLHETCGGDWGGF